LFFLYKVKQSQKNAVSCSGKKRNTSFSATLCSVSLSGLQGDCRWPDVAVTPTVGWQVVLELVLIEAYAMSSPPAKPSTGVKGDDGMSENSGGNTI
jgi:hypothetical protein